MRPMRCCCGGLGNLNVRTPKKDNQVVGIVCGLAAYLVNWLTLEILNYRYVPYYSTASSNTAFQRIVRRVDNYSAWTCVNKGKFDGLESSQNLEYSSAKVTIVSKPIGTFSLYDSSLPVIFSIRSVPICFLTLLLFSHIIPTKVLDEYSYLQKVIPRFP